MGRKENLKTIRSVSEAREMGAKGGRASGESRRKKRDAREAAKLLLDLAAKGQLDGNLEQMGVKTQDRTNQAGIIACHIVKAQSGDERSALLVFELSGDMARNGAGFAAASKVKAKAETVIAPDPYDGLTTEELRRLAAKAEADAKKSS